MFFDVDVLDHINEKFGFFWVHHFCISHCHPERSEGPHPFSLRVRKLSRVINRFLRDPSLCSG